MIQGAFSVRNIGAGLAVFGAFHRKNDFRIFTFRSFSFRFFTPADALSIQQFTGFGDCRIVSGAVNNHVHRSIQAHAFGRVSHNGLGNGEDVRFRGSGCGLFFSQNRHHRNQADAHGQRQQQVQFFLFLIQN